MAILDLIRPDESAPVILIVSASELNARGGALLHEAGMGAIIRVDDCQRGRPRRTVAWIVPADEPPERIRGYLDRLPPPGEASDHLATELAPSEVTS